MKRLLFLVLMAVCFGVSAAERTDLTAFGPNTRILFHGVFDEACKRVPAEYWIWDGVHPTFSGHQLLADEWAKTVSASFK